MLGYLKRGWNRVCPINRALLTNNCLLRNHATSQPYNKVLKLLHKLEYMHNQFRSILYVSELSHR